MVSTRRRSPRWRSICGLLGERAPRCRLFQFNCGWQPDGQTRMGGCVRVSWRSQCPCHTHPFKHRSLPGVVEWCCGVALPSVIAAWSKARPGVLGIMRRCMIASIVHWRCAARRASQHAPLHVCVSLAHVCLRLRHRVGVARRGAAAWRGEAGRGTLPVGRCFGDAFEHQGNLMILKLRHDGYHAWHVVYDEY